MLQFASSSKQDELLLSSYSGWDPPDSPYPPSSVSPSNATSSASPCGIERKSLPAFVLALLLLSTAVYLHAFASSHATPALQYATCASTIADGPCASAGGAPCDLRCPPRCGDRWSGNATAYAVFFGGSGAANRTYRGDSKLCRAAVHAGLFPDAVGGCARVAFSAGGPAAYAGSAQNGVQALPGGYYPFSFSLSPSPARSCASLQWPFLALVVVLSFLSFLLLSRGAAFALSCAAMFVYLLFTARGGDPFLTAALGAGCAISTGALFFCVWWASVRHALRDAEGEGGGGEGQEVQLPLPRGKPCSRALCTAVLFLLPFIFMAHMNLLTVFLPDFEFSSSLRDLSPGALAFVGCLLALVVGGAAFFSRQLFLSGLAPLYLATYLTLAASALILSVLTRSRFSVHIHHSILALVLLPLVRFPTAPALILSGLLCGMLCNGLAFWGVAGPWDLLQAPLLAAPNCSISASSGEGGTVRVAWAECAAPLPPAALFSLSLNGAPVYTGTQQQASVALPAGVNATFSLALAFADSTASSSLSFPTFFT